LYKSHPKISARTAVKVVSGKVVFQGNANVQKRNESTFPFVDSATLETDAATQRRTQTNWDAKHGTQVMSKTINVHPAAKSA